MEPPTLKDYISAQAEREVVTIRRFFALGSGVLAHWFAPTLGWQMPYVWLGLRIPHERLLKGFKRPPKKFKGDVDVFGAPLEAVSPEEYQRCVKEQRKEFARLRAELPDQEDHEVPELTLHNVASVALVAEGKIKWPPDLSYIAAVEVKAAHFDANDDLKGTGDKHNGRDQAKELCEMGFNRVALARFVVTAPYAVPGHHDWLVASARGSKAADEYLHESKGIAVTDDDPYGTVLISAGSVLGKLEHHAGATSARWLKKPPENPRREQAGDIRKVMEENLLEVMSRYPAPRSVPAIILACSDDKCGHLYLAGVYLELIQGAESSFPPCPNCGKPSR